MGASSGHAMGNKSLTLGKVGNRSPVSSSSWKQRAKRQLEVDSDIDARAAITSLVVKHVFGPGKMEEGLVLSLGESYCYYFSRLT